MLIFRVPPTPNMNTWSHAREITPPSSLVRSSKMRNRECDRIAPIWSFRFITIRINLCLQEEVAETWSQGICRISYASSTTDINTGVNIKRKSCWVRRERQWTLCQLLNMVTVQMHRDDQRSVAVANWSHDHHINVESWCLTMLVSLDAFQTCRGTFYFRNTTREMSPVWILQWTSAYFRA